MEHGAAILFALLVAFGAAQVGKEIAQRLKLPGVVGEIAAGVLIGPFAFNWLGSTELPTLEIFAELGAVFLLFAVGLETRLGDLKKVGKVSASVGVLGVILPFVAAVVLAEILRFPLNKALFFGAAFVATSAGITARVLQELQTINHRASQVILGAAVIDDILAMLLLGVVTSLQSGKVDWISIGFVLVQAVGFIVLVAFVGGRLIRKSPDFLDLPLNPNSTLALSITICLGLAFLSVKIGLAAIIGAFLAGMILAESKHRKVVERHVVSINEFIVPFFFVITGAHVNLKAFASPQAIGFVVLVTVLAIATKYIGGFLGALSLGKREAKIVGIGMIPRGEVGIIVAALGLRVGAFSDQMYSTIIAMSLLTAIVSPPLLQRAFSNATKGRTVIEDSNQLQLEDGSDDQT